MRGLAAFAALLAALMVLTPGPARAYRGPATAAALELTTNAAVVDRWVRERRYDRGRDWRRSRYRRDRRAYRRSGWRWRTDCHRQWRNGRPERVCRRIRYRR